MVAPKIKTPNGRPTSVADLNVNSPIQSAQSQGRLARLSAGLKRLNLILAGMYTGVNCYGVPHEEHSYGEKPEEVSKEK